MQMNEDYRITDSKFGYLDKDDLFGVELLTGKFAGVTYTYGTIHLPEGEVDDSYTISFNYEIRTKDLVKEEDVPEFESVIGDVLNSVIINSLEEAEKRYNNEIRNKNSKASDQQ